VLLCRVTWSLIPVRTTATRNDGVGGHQGWAAVLTLLPGTQVGFSAPDQRQSCSGILTHDEDGYMLKPDAGSKSLWCAAYIGEDEKSPLAQRVLKTCMLVKSLPYRRNISRARDIRLDRDIVGLNTEAVMRLVIRV
jgi:hypothetical protein